MHVNILGALQRAARKDELRNASSKHIGLLSSYTYLGAFTVLWKKHPVTCQMSKMFKRERCCWMHFPGHILRHPANIMMFIQVTTHCQTIGDRFSGISYIKVMLKHDSSRHRTSFSPHRSSAGPVLKPSSTSASYVPATSCWRKDEPGLDDQRLLEPLKSREFLAVSLEQRVGCQQSPIRIDITGISRQFPRPSSQPVFCLRPWFWSNVMAKDSYS